MKDDRAAAGGAARRRTSPWAVASLLCALAMCPPLCVIGPVLGVAALWRIRRDAAVKGRGLAVMAIILGTLLTAAWSAGAAWLHVRNFRPVRDGPVAAIERGYAGDIEAFKTRFTAEGTGRPDAEAAAFIDTLRSRYGEFRSSRQDCRAMEDGPAIDPARPRLCYVFEFERGRVGVEAIFVRFDAAAGRLVLRFESIVVRDPERGDFAYPVSALAGEESEREADEAATPVTTDD